MVSYLITDASRGIGLAMAGHLLTFPASEVTCIFATASRESTALKTLIQASVDRMHFIELDIKNEHSLNVAIAEVEYVLDGAGLDVLINNSGKTLVTPKTMSKVFVQRSPMKVG